MIRDSSYTISLLFLLLLLNSAIFPGHFPFLELFLVFLSEMYQNFILFYFLFIELANEPFLFGRLLLFE